MQQEFRGDFIPETTNLSQRREGKMKQQFRFLLAGFSLIALLVWHAVPVEAQQTTFSATLVQLSITVSPPSITLGSQQAGATVTSAAQTATPPITVTNTSTVQVQLFVACTNAHDPTEGVNPSWICEKTANGADMFTAGVSTTTAAGPFTALEGPIGSGPSAEFPNPGTIKAIGVPAAPNAVVVVDWKVGLPTTSGQNGSQEWQFIFAASMP